MELQSKCSLKDPYYTIFIFSSWTPEEHLRTKNVIDL